MEENKKSPHVAGTTGEEKDAWYFKQNKYLDLAISVLALIISIMALVITLSN